MLLLTTILLPRLPPRPPSTADITIADLRAPQRAREYHNVFATTERRGNQTPTVLQIPANTTRMHNGMPDPAGAAIACVQSDVCKYHQ